MGTDSEDVIAYDLKDARYLNLTNACGILRCAFCPKYNGSWNVKDYNMKLSFVPTADEIVEAAGDPAKYREIVFCGFGECTTRLDVLIEVAKRLRVKGAKRIRLNTNGMGNLYHGRNIAPELAHVLDAVSVSMNAQDKETYDKLCRPKRSDAFEGMLDFLKCAKEAGLEVTATAVDGNEGVDIAACEKIASDIGVPFRRRVLDDLV